MTGQFQVDLTFLLGVLSIGGILVAGFFTFRNKAWRDNAEGYRAEAERHKALAQEKEAAIKRQEDRVHELQSVVQELGGAKVMEQILRMAEQNNERYAMGMTAVGNLFKHHEERAVERHERILALFDRLLERA